MFARVLFLLLLAANLGFGAWLVLAPPVAVAQLPPTDPGVAVLTLLNERDGALADAAELARAPEPIGADHDLRCTTLGPFPTQSDLRRAMTALTQLTERIQFRESRALRSRGWWVYLPAFASRDAALSAARELSSKGVRDY
ncbi:MAG TPA: SPOR domain-containing protein, partial [Patescibacteria group bacterium]|nr:SPOR domain-containing protein [Patescibacteria group bacterium]